MNPTFRAIPRLVRRLAPILALGLAVPAIAGPGHEGGHDHDEAPVLTAGQALPRFEAHSDLFEVVGALDHGELSLTLDAYATNEPVPDAQIELESGSYKTIGEYRPLLGTYRFESGPFGGPGSYPITLTITAGNDVDLLAADLVVPQIAPDSAATDAPASDKRLLWGAGSVVAFLALAFGLSRRRRAAV